MYVFLHNTEGRQEHCGQPSDMRTASELRSPKYTLAVTNIKKLYIIFIIDRKVINNDFVDEPYGIKGGLYI